MRIGAALATIAVGAILRFALAVSVTHGIYLNVIGDILIGVGLLGLILWFVMCGPWSQDRRTTYRPGTMEDPRAFPPPDSRRPGAYPREQVPYEDEYRR